MLDMSREINFVKNLPKIEPQHVNALDFNALQTHQFITVMSNARSSCAQWSQVSPGQPKVGLSN